MRQITPSDIHAAQRGWNMVGKSVPDLRDLEKEILAFDPNLEQFAARVIVMGARQIIAVKKRNGAEG